MLHYSKDNQINPSVVVLQREVVAKATPIKVSNSSLIVSPIVLNNKIEAMALLTIVT